MGQFPKKRCFPKSPPGDNPARESIDSNVVKTAFNFTSGSINISLHDCRSRKGGLLQRSKVKPTITHTNSFLFTTENVPASNPAKRHMSQKQGNAKRG